MSLKIQISIPYALDDMVQAATMVGYLREDERKRWTEKEKREAARWLAERCLVHTMQKEFGRSPRTSRQ